MLNINYPWYIYHNLLATPYTKFELYKKESIRFQKFIKELQINYNTLVHISIGAAMEEYREINKQIGIQWRQLFPIHVEEYIYKNKKNNVKIIIISPNNMFSEENFTPSFVNVTNDDYEWKKITPLKYINKDKNITVDIFCTFFPHIDCRNNRIKEMLKKIKNTIPKPSNIIQTKKDIQFVEEFYNDLKKLFIRIDEKKCTITCFSFAVFKNIFKEKYEMFSKLQDFFKNKNKNRLIAEWVYSKNITYIIHYKSYKSFKINYSKYINKNKYNITIKNNGEISLIIM